MSAEGRKAELTRKRAKLAALREERLKKEEKQIKNSFQFIGSSCTDPLSVDGILKELGVTNNFDAIVKVNDENSVDSLFPVTLDSK